MADLEAILSQPHLEEDDIVFLLGLRDPDQIERLRLRAVSVLETHVGASVYYRGLIELSNVCACNCYYCGIRSGNAGLKRFTLSESEVMEAAAWCARAGYGSLVLQAGERRDARFASYVEHLIRRIRAESVLEELPQGLGITLSLGEQSLETYRRWREAGAHRYLLRVETTDPDLFAGIHPPAQTLERRLRALEHLAAAGFQVGTGVMIGIPGQSLIMLARDILFFRDHPIDMIGMGPWLPHPDVPMGDWEQPLSQQERLQLALNMIAVTRLVCRDINIASTTALEAIVSDGRERGLLYGANVAMPNLTPGYASERYRLYEGKPGLEAGAEQCRGRLFGLASAAGRAVALNQWGDAPHFARRQKSKERPRAAGPEPGGDSGS